MHATVQREGFTVPLIGIPMRSVLETCDLCGEEQPLRLMRFNGRQFLCRKCDYEMGEK